MFTSKLQTTALLVVVSAILGGDALAQKTKVNALPADITAPIVAVAPDGKAFTVEIRPRVKGEQTQRVNVKVTEQTKLRFSAVTNDGARLVAGYQAQVWMQNGSPEIAESVSITGSEHFKPVPQLAGRVTKITDGGKKITIETSAVAAKGKGANATSGNPAKSIEVSIPESATVTFSGVAPGGAKATEGYEAAVFLKEGAQNVAAAVRFSGALDTPKKGAMEPLPLYTGKIVDAADNGKQVTLEMTSKWKTQAPELITVELNETTQQVYMNVPPGGAKPTNGYDVQAWFGEAAAGPATKVRFTGPLKDQRPDLTGLVRSVSPDGQSIVLLGKPKNKDEAPGEVTVTITNQTKLIYNNVPLGGARPAAGMEAQVWRAEPTNATAARIIFAYTDGLSFKPGKLR